MPRRREVPKRRIIPDPKFKDKLVAKFTNSLLSLMHLPRSPISHQSSTNMISNRSTPSLPQSPKLLCSQTNTHS